MILQNKQHKPLTNVFKSILTALRSNHHTTINKTGNTYTELAKKKNSIYHPNFDNGIDANMGSILGIVGTFTPNGRHSAVRWDEQVVPAIEEPTTVRGTSKNVINRNTDVNSELEQDETRAIESYMNAQGVSKSCIENGKDYITSKCGDQIIDHTGHSISAMDNTKGFRSGTDGEVHFTNEKVSKNLPLVVHSDGLTSHIKHDINTELSAAIDPTNGYLPMSNIQSFQEFNPYRGMNVLNQLQDDPSFDEMEYKSNHQPLGLPRESTHSIEHNKGSAYHSLVQFHHGGMFHTDLDSGNHGNHGDIDILGAYIGPNGGTDKTKSNYNYGSSFEDNHDHFSHENSHDYHDSNSLENEAIEHKIAAFSQAVGHPFVASTHSSEDSHSNNGRYGAGEIYMHTGLFPGSRMHDAFGDHGNDGDNLNHHDNMEANDGNSDHNNDDGDLYGHNDHDDGYTSNENEDESDHGHGHEGQTIVDHHIYHHRHQKHHHQQHQEDTGEGRDGGHTYNIGGSIGKKFYYVY